MDHRIKLTGALAICEQIFDNMSLSMKFDAFNIKFKKFLYGLFKEYNDQFGSTSSSNSGISCSSSQTSVPILKRKKCNECFIRNNGII